MKRYATPPRFLRIDPEYVLPPGTTLTKQLCEGGNLKVTGTAYHSDLRVGASPVPEFTVATEWLNPRASFDNVAVSMWTLFQARARAFILCAFAPLQDPLPHAPPNSLPKYLSFFLQTYKPSEPH